MPAEHPALLRRWWWRSPVAVRLLPATALVAATAAAGLHALPSGPDKLAQPATPPAAPAPAAAAPTTTVAPPTTTAPTSPTTSPRPATSTPSTTSRTPVPTAPPTTASTTPRPPEAPPPPPRPTTAPTSTSDDADDEEEDGIPVVRENQRCSEEGAVARTPSGAAATCRTAPDGELRWTTRW